MQLKCNNCNDEWHQDAVWMMAYCPRCGSTNVEEIKALPVGVQVKYIEPGSAIDLWWKKAQKHIKKDT